MAVTHSVSDQGLLQSWSNNWDNSDKHKLFISFHFSAAANVDNAGEIELSEWCISFISTEVLFISWFVFLAFALISSLPGDITVITHDDVDGGDWWCYW